MMKEFSFCVWWISCVRKQGKTSILNDWRLSILNFPSNWETFHKFRIPVPGIFFPKKSKKMDYFQNHEGEADLYKKCTFFHNHKSDADFFVEKNWKSHTQPYQFFQKIQKKYVFMFVWFEKMKRKFFNFWNPCYNFFTRLWKKMWFWSIFSQKNPLFFDFLEKKVDFLTKTAVFSNTVILLIAIFFYFLYQEIWFVRKYSENWQQKSYWKLKIISSLTRKLENSSEPKILTRTVFTVFAWIYEEYGTNEERTSKKQLKKFLKVKNDSLEKLNFLVSCWLFSKLNW